MDSSIELANSEYVLLEQQVEEWISAGKTDAAADEIMRQIDVILQSVLFCAAIEDGMYFDGESSFLYSVVRHYDVLTEFNRNLGATLKKPLTWEGLVFLPMPGKRHMTEALRAEASKAMQNLRGFLQKDARSCTREKLLKIAAYFSRIDLAQKGSQLADSELAASERELDLLFGVD